ncbi:hypothetical protein [Arthrobacter sp. PM3]|uniref:hypothetical protein n=1 Tax=Arthrobacter sp. PM3 TaxID=2017685 RepID=UPI001ABFC2BB|nr:hypothetical protein [Arthrobacter sp. PM3]
MIFPDFSAFRSPAASAPAAPPGQAVGAQDLPSPAPVAAEPPALDPVATEKAANPEPEAPAPPPPATRARKGRLAAPPFSWLGGDAWPHFPAWADKKA